MLKTFLFLSMNYSEDTLKKIEELAEIYVTISDMAVLLDIPADILREDIRNRNSPAHKAYNRGKVQSKIKLRAQEMKLASIGSPLALENTRKNLLDMEDDE